MEPHLVMSTDLLRSFIVNKECRFLCHFFDMFNTKPTQRLKLGTFSIDKGDGSENITFKMNWRFFQLCRVYFNSLKYLWDRTQVQKEKEKFAVACFTFSLPSPSPSSLLKLSTDISRTESFSACVLVPNPSQMSFSDISQFQHASISKLLKPAADQTFVQFDGQSLCVSKVCSFGLI